MGILTGLKAHSGINGAVPVVTLTGASPAVTQLRDLTLYLSRWFPNSFPAYSLTQKNIQGLQPDQENRWELANGLEQKHLAGCSQQPLL